MNNNDPLRAVWTNWGKRNGGPTEWKPLVKDGDPQRGDLIIVERKNGETQEKRVVRALWSDVSKYSGTRETIVDVVDADADLSLAGQSSIPSGSSAVPVQSVSDAWNQAVRLPNGAVLTVTYQAPVEDAATPAESTTPAETTAAGDDQVDGGIPF